MTDSDPLSSAIVKLRKIAADLAAARTQSVLAHGEAEEALKLVRAAGAHGAAADLSYAVQATSELLEPLKNLAGRFDTVVKSAEKAQTARG